jgi:hypothetical protein
MLCSGPHKKRLHQRTHAPAGAASHQRKNRAYFNHPCPTPLPARRACSAAGAKGAPEAAGRVHVVVMVQGAAARRPRVLNTRRVLTACSCHLRGEKAREQLGGGGGVQGGAQMGGERERGRETEGIGGGGGSHHRWWWWCGGEEHLLTRTTAISGSSSRASRQASRSATAQNTIDSLCDHQPPTTPRARARWRSHARPHTRPAKRAHAERRFRRTAGAMPARFPSAL